MGPDLWCLGWGSQVSEQLGSTRCGVSLGFYKTYLFARCFLTLSTTNAAVDRVALRKSQQ